MTDDLPSVMYAWELGGGLGHVTKGLLLAKELSDAGFEVSFGVRDLAATHPLLPDASYRLYQAPVCWSRLRDAPEPSSHAELLLHAGFGDRAALQGMVRGWLTLFEADRTRLLVADHAPSAVLAARCAGLPVALFGHGFFAPPAGWPAFRTWESVPAGQVERAAQQVLGAINECLAEYGVEPLPRASDLFDGVPSFLCTEPELDHYQGRDFADAPVTYVGTLWVDDVGAAAEWPVAGDTRQRVFAYLRPGLPGLEGVLEALQRSGAAVLVASPGLAAGVVARWQGPTLSFTRQLVRLRDVARQADLVVCSGSDTLHGMAQAGVPVLGLPMNAEQRIAAERIADSHAGRWLLPASGAESVLEALRQLLDDPAYRAAARRLQQRCVRRGSSTQLAPVVDACRRLAGTDAAIPFAG